MKAIVEMLQSLFKDQAIETEIKLLQQRVEDLKDHEQDLNHKVKWYKTVLAVAVTIAIIAAFVATEVLIHD